MIETLTFNIIMFGVIMILFTFLEITFYLEDRKTSKTEIKKKSKEERIQEYVDIRNEVDKIIGINNV
jgi:hypothetical protein